MFRIHGRVSPVLGASGLKSYQHLFGFSERPEFEKLCKKDEERKRDGQQRRGQPNFHVVSWRPGVQRSGDSWGKTTIKLRQDASDNRDEYHVRNAFRRLRHVGDERVLEDVENNDRAKDDRYW